MKIVGRNEATSRANLYNAISYGLHIDLSFQTKYESGMNAKYCRKKMEKKIVFIQKKRRIQDTLNKKTDRKM